LWDRKSSSLQKKGEGKGDIFGGKSAKEGEMNLARKRGCSQAKDWGGRK